MEEIEKTITEFGITLVEEQHRYFLYGSIDNSEHISAIKRLADTAYNYLKQKEVDLDSAKNVKRELIDHGRKLFIKIWMKAEEGEEPLGEEDRQEAMETFDELLKENNR